MRSLAVRLTRAACSSLYFAPVHEPVEWWLVVRVASMADKQVILL